MNKKCELNVPRMPQMAVYIHQNSFDPEIFLQTPSSNLTTKSLHFWYAGPRFAYTRCKFGGSTMEVINAICENNARPCVKRRMSFRA